IPDYAGRIRGAIDFMWLGVMPAVTAGQDTRLQPHGMGLTGERDCDRCFPLTANRQITDADNRGRNRNTWCPAHAIGRYSTIYRGYRPKQPSTPVTLAPPELRCLPVYRHDYLVISACRRRLTIRGCRNGSSAISVRDK